MYESLLIGEQADANYSLLQDQAVHRHHPLQDCSVHLHLLQFEAGAVFEEGWRNSIDIAYDRIDYSIQPWSRFWSRSCYTWSAEASQPLQLIVYNCFKK